jgi:hypothetical protein
MPMYGPLLFLVILGLGLGLRLMAGSLDRERIEGYVTGKGGRIVSISWAPFGRGWFGEKNERIYEVVYYDAEGRQHFATAKTSLWSGVYWTHDAVTHEKPSWYAQVPKSNERDKPVVVEIEKAVAATPVVPDPDPFGELEFLRRENQRLRDEAAKRDAPPDPSRSRDYEPRRPR